ncbi:MAG TPA: low molecular weight protein arginine phosphatase [bacterium]|nr:low molecular weight protein arginine phosphatase [bacterium]
MAKKVLFVCTGNTCRSPMAEGLLKKMAKDQGLDLEVRSAGLAAFAGLPVAPEAVEACRTKDVDISGHQTQPLGKNLVMESDLILTMTAKHKEMIVKKMPALEPKVLVLSELAGEGMTDVEDPVGQPVEAYQAALDQIEGYLLRSLDRLKN